MKTLKSSILIISFIPKLLALEVSDLYKGIRPLGMGNAFISISDDENAVFYNPAGLTRTKKLRFSPFNAQITGNDEVILSLYKTTTSITTLPSVKTLLDENNGRRLHFDFKTFPHLMIKNFSIGTLFSHNFNADLRKDGSTNYINVQSTTDMGPFLTMSFNFFSNILKVGSTGKMLLRSTLDKEFSSSDITVASFQNELYEGIGFGFDVGGILALPFKLLPSIGVQWKDVGNTKFPIFREIFTKNSPGRPSRIPETLNAGVSLSPIITPPHLKMNIAADYRDIFSKTETVFLKKLHLGTELNYMNKFYFRVGANQGYWTLGLSFATDVSRFELATYGEELGLTEWKNEDRRYMVKYTMMF